MSEKLLLVGGGGHCMSVLDTLLSTKKYTEICIIDRIENVGNDILGIPIIGCDDDLSRLYLEGFTNAFVTVGSVANTNLRVKLFRILEEIGFETPNIIDPTAIISENVLFDKGIFVGKNAVINVGANIHKGCIINTSSVIEHECEIGEFSHISPRAVLCGQVYIGENTHIGANSVIKQQIKIGNNTIVGMGSVVLKNIGNNIVAYGNPCKEVRQ